MTTFKSLPTSPATKSTVTSGELNNTTDPVTFTVASATNWPTSNFWVAIWDANTYPDPNDDPALEILLVASRTGTSCASSVRGALGTSNAAHAGTPHCRPLIFGQHFADLHTAITALEAVTATTASPTYANLTLSTGGAVRTGTSSGNTALLQAYDVNDTTYRTFATLTAGNTPTMDLATDVTIGTAYIHRVGGTDVALADGGTNASLTADNGGIVYSTATAMAILASTATASQMLQSGSSGAPAWSTATWPATTTANQLLYSSSANTVTGLTSGNSSILATNGSGVPAWGTDIPTAVTIGGAYVHRVGGTDVAVGDGGTGASTAAAAASNLGLGTGDSPQFTAINLGHATDTTITRTGAGDIAVEGNAVYRAGGTDVPITDGGTGASTATAGFDNLSPLTTLGDVLYHNGTNNVRLAGNTTATKKFLRQTGNGSVSAAPAWDTLVAGDIPDLSGTYQPLDSGLTALADFNTNGILCQTANNTFAGRTITGTSNQVTVTDGDGVAGNPTLSLPQDIHTTASPTFTGLTVTSVTGASGGGAISVNGGTATASEGSAGGAATYRSANGSSTGSGGNGGALNLTAGSAQGDQTVSRAGGAVNITSGAGRGPAGPGAVVIAGGSAGTSSTANGSTGTGHTWTGGGGGNTTRTDGVAGSGGNGAAVNLTGGTGGSATGVNAAANTGGNGGGITVSGGTAGTASNGSSNTGGNGGAATLQGGAAAATAGSAGGAANVTGRAGTSTGSGGNGGSVSIDGGDAGGDNTTGRTGGSVTITTGDAKGGTGGAGFQVTGGSGGTTTTGDGSTATGWTHVASGGGSTARTDGTNGSGGTGAAWTERAGTGGTASGVNAATNTGGAGGAFTVQAGTGGAATNGNTNNGGAGGQLVLAGGVGGTGASAAGAGGSIVLQTASTTSLTTRITIANSGVTTFSYATQHPVRSITGDRTLDETDETILANATGGAIVVTLPAASGCTGRVYRIKKTAGGNTVTIDGNASETIDGDTTLVLSTIYEAATIQSDGSNWHRFS